jgi:hypothetical protein
MNKTIDILRLFWKRIESEKTGMKYSIKTNGLSEILEKIAFNIYKEGREYNTGEA